MTDDFTAPHREGGVRRNALTAPAWAKLLDVDPRVADALLEALEDAGVAAYAQPVAGEVGVYRDVRPPTTPTDRVYVDVSRHDIAEAVLAAELPGLLDELRPADDDAAFAAIVASWDADAIEPVPPWPVDEDVDTITRLPDPPRPVPELVGVPEPAEEHYVPPPPEPLPQAHPVTRWAAIAVAAGLFLIVVLPLLGTVPSAGTQVLGILAIVGGIGTLVWRMRDTTPPDDSDPDDGAVV